jgi:hypothetical protein
VKRLIFVIAALSMSAVLVSVGLVMSQPATAASHHSLLPPLHGTPQGVNGHVVTAGSTWTMYELLEGERWSCVVLYPGPSRAFSDDQGGAGRWRSSTGIASFTWTSGSYDGISFKDTLWDNIDLYWVGLIASDQYRYGPEILVQGKDPFNWGSC